MAAAGGRSSGVAKRAFEISECSLHYACLYDICQQACVNTIWRQHAARAFVVVVENIVPSMNEIWHTVFQSEEERNNAEKRVGRVVHACAEDHILLDMTEFRHFVRLQICWHRHWKRSAERLLAQTPSRSVRTVDVRCFIGMLLATIHQKSAGTAICDRILHLCPVRAITESAINNLSYAYRRDCWSRFCIPSILGVLEQASAPGLNFWRRLEEGAKTKTDRVR